MPVDTPPTDSELRTAIADIIRTALQSYYNPLTLDIRVHNSWVLGFDVGETAALLRKRTGEGAGDIHGWLVGLDSVKRSRPLLSGGKRQSDYSLRLKQGDRRDITRTYRVWAFYQLNTGIEGSEDISNSETIMAEELEAVADAFSNKPTLDINNSCMRGHTELYFDRIDVFSFGGSHANVAQGKIEVSLVHNIT